MDFIPVRQQNRLWKQWELFSSDSQPCNHMSGVDMKLSRSHWNKGEGAKEQKAEKQSWNWLKRDLLTIMMAVLSWKLTGIKWVILPAWERSIQKGPLLVRIRGFLREKKHFSSPWILFRSIFGCWRQERRRESEKEMESDRMQYRKILWKKLI